MSVPFGVLRCIGARAQFPGVKTLLLCLITADCVCEMAEFQGMLSVCNIPAWAAAVDWQQLLFPLQHNSSLFAQTSARFRAVVGIQKGG